MVADENSNFLIIAGNWRRRDNRWDRMMMRMTDVFDIFSIALLLVLSFLAAGYFYLALDLTPAEFIKWWLIYSGMAIGVRCLMIYTTQRFAILDKKREAELTPPSRGDAVRVPYRKFRSYDCSLHRKNLWRCTCPVKSRTFWANEHFPWCKFRLWSQAGAQDVDIIGQAGGLWLKIGLLPSLIAGLIWLAGNGRRSLDRD